MMDWTRLVSNLLKHITKKLPRDCMLQGYMFASLGTVPQIKKRLPQPLQPQPGESIPLALARPCGWLYSNPAAGTNQHSVAFAFLQGARRIERGTCIHKQHLSNTTCLTQVLFKRGEYFCKLRWSLTP